MAGKMAAAAGWHRAWVPPCSTAQRGGAGPAARPAAVWHVTAWCVGGGGGGGGAQRAVGAREGGVRGGRAREKKPCPGLRKGIGRGWAGQVCDFRKWVGAVRGHGGVPWRRAAHARVHHGTGHGGMGAGCATQRCRPRGTRRQIAPKCCVARTLAGVPMPQKSNILGHGKNLGHTAPYPTPVSGPATRTKTRGSAYIYRRCSGLTN